MKSLVIAKKEIMDLTRDRRTMMMMFIVPFFAMPLMFALVFNLQKNIQEKALVKILIVALFLIINFTPFKIFSRFSPQFSLLWTVKRINSLSQSKFSMNGFWEVLEIFKTASIGKSGLDESLTGITSALFTKCWSCTFVLALIFFWLNMSTFFWTLNIL